MDWNNVNLKDAYERDQEFLSGICFSTLLLEIYTNFREEEITEEKVAQYVQNRIKMNVDCAMEIINSNIKNIVAYARKEK